MLVIVFFSDKFGGCFCGYIVVSKIKSTILSFIIDATIYNEKKFKQTHKIFVLFEKERGSNIVGDILNCWKKKTFRLHFKFYGAISIKINTEIFHFKKKYVFLAQIKSRVNCPKLANLANSIHP